MLGSLGGLLFAQFTVLLDVVKYCARITSSWRLRWRGVNLDPTGIDESLFPTDDDLQSLLDKLESTGYRSTGSKAHEEWINFIEDRLSTMPGIQLTTDQYKLQSWQIEDGCTLKGAATLSIIDPAKVRSEIPIIGVIPYSQSSDATGEMIYLPRSTPLTEDMVRGKVVLRDFGGVRIPNAVAMLPSYAKTLDLYRDLFSTYERPGIGSAGMTKDLHLAGRFGAAGLIIMWDLPREQLESYFEPHDGTHFRVPAIYVGVDEAVRLRHMAELGSCFASISVKAEIVPTTTRNVLATLPGQDQERVMFVSHTDGNTLVQENGAIALLALAQYFSRQPVTMRRRTIQFAFNTGHLHMSREGSVRQASQEKDSETLALVVAMEHMGTRQIEAVPRTAKPGRRLKFTGRGETMVWCAGPSAVVVEAVCQAVARRRLDRTLITRGTNRPDSSRVPTFTLFGGIGTSYHNCLIPTTSLISGPWSLWAPSFGQDAMDVSRFRAQTLALGDIYTAVEDVSKEEIAGGYLDYKRRRDQGAPVYEKPDPPEYAS